MICVPDWDDIFDTVSINYRTSQISSGLAFAFDWKEWQPGFDYWKDVAVKLFNSNSYSNKPMPVNNLHWPNIFTDACAHTPEEKARVIASGLNYAFVWHTSEEGHNYWFGIHTNLHHLSKIKIEVENESIKTDVWWDKSLPKRLP
jgi:hypothetical protein